MKRLPLRHLSIRVPWHDNAWNGTVCSNPKGNPSCLVLKNIREKRDDLAESSNAGMTIDGVAPGNWPACIGERGTFMAPFALHRRVGHPYSGTSDEHRHIKPATFHHPAYSAATIPFFWMMRENAWTLAERFGLDARESREPKKGFLEKTLWVQDQANQGELLNAFFSAVEPEKSLCFFYAKQTPLSDSEDRVLIGAGRVAVVGPLVDYEYENQGGLKSYVWDRSIEHSVRPDCSDGFLMPYHEILARAAQDASIVPETFVAAAPSDRRSEFSYAGEHVTHDAAIASLLSLRAALERWEPFSSLSLGKQFSWLDARLGELWKLRGPAPGLGAVLCAFGITEGNFLAYALAEHLGENEAPWDVLNALFVDPIKFGTKAAKLIGVSQKKKWQEIADGKNERLALFQLLARMELTPEQAERFYVPEVRESRGIRCTDAEILANPYLLYELDRRSEDPISVWTVDRGAFPAPVVAEKHPLPTPSAVDDATDPRRVRALSCQVLEEAAADGHTLLPRRNLVIGIREMALEPRCLVDGDLFDAIEDTFAETITLAEMAEGSTAYQLAHLAQATAVIRRAVDRRVGGARLEVEADWAGLLAEALKGAPADSLEGAARDEKAAALTELAASRFSVLIGPAGTGKTTLLNILTGHPGIRSSGILKLAPTGKARVRMGADAKTLAQFLLPLGRYDEKTGVYKVGGEGKFDGASTVIVDEASMLTEEQLAALIDSLKGVERLILVGDQRQLPPIGAGRPFYDIVEHLRPDGLEAGQPQVGPGFAELRIRRRHIGETRADVDLAAWFSGESLGAGEDEVLSKSFAATNTESLRFVQWDTQDDLRSRLLETLVEVLKLDGDSDTRGFARALGATDHGEWQYFNLGAAAVAEDWQILSPVRGLTHGVRDLNRFVQSRFREDTISWARAWKTSQIPRPMGPEGIVYGDKVINIRNRWRKDVWPKDGALEYVANGEIGIAIGEFRGKGTKGSGRPKRLHVEFSSQRGHSYSFRAGEMGDEGEPILELAYAITVHKAQGSEFGTSVLVLPAQSRVLSRELIYTAMTRQRDSLIILHEGDFSGIRAYTDDYYSDTKSRLTNLFAPPSPVAVRDRFLEERLIHRSSLGEPMRSKSEVIIADLLATRQIDYEYEAPLSDRHGVTRWPDFTIVDDETGTTYYWEHCGMLGDPGYAARWKTKLGWYRDQAIVPAAEGGTLIITEDDLRGGIDSQQIAKLIDTHLR